MSWINISIFVLYVTLVSAYAIDQSLEDEELEAEIFMNELNEEINKWKNLETVASWDYASNITEETNKHNIEVSAESAKFYKEKAIEINAFNYHAYKNEDLKRQFKKLSKLGYAALPEDKFKRLLNAISAMESTYAKVRICSFKDKHQCNLQLEPEITEILLESNDPEELKYYFKEWYDKAGAPSRHDFETYLTLVKESAQLNNFTSAAEVWLDQYEDSTFEQQLDNILEQIRPFFQQIHAHVRNKLHEKYGNIVKLNEPIPMHLLGNMWGQQWSSIQEFTMPYPSVPTFDVTDEMVNQKYTQLKMFQMGDEFFQSLNMTKLPDKFWKNSIIEKPNDGRDLICHASAWDFYLDNDVRIKQCTRITMDQLFTVHHELGHIQYYLQYAHQPSVYREGANPGFHEAVGDVLSLSVSTPKHLQKIGLLKDYKISEEAIINKLYGDALEKIVFLPFAYTLDKYRLNVFRGDIKPTEYNCKFWKMREKYSGISPPTQRYETDLDAPAKYHVSADVEYFRYFVSFIVQFQFHKSLCMAAGEYVPGDPQKILSNCDIYQSPAAGKLMKSMLSMGSSKPWPDAMEVMTGQRKMDASAIIEYFKPLQDWLEKTNKMNGVHIGWDKTYECKNHK